MASDRNTKVKAVFKLMRTRSYWGDASSYWREMAQTLLTLTLIGNLHLLTIWIQVQDAREDAKKLGLQNNWSIMRNVLSLSQELKKKIRYVQ